MSRSRDNPETAPSDDGRVRIDQWLWAARFFKTRSLAAEAVGGGKVEVDGERVKRSRVVRVGDTIRIRMPPFEHVVAVRALSARRGPASAAQQLYEETTESRDARERLAWQLKHATIRTDFEQGKPSKKERRDWDRLRRRS